METAEMLSPRVVTDHNYSEEIREQEKQDVNTIT
jgi:hypothetical protein